MKNETLKGAKTRGGNPSSKSGETAPVTTKSVEEKHEEYLEKVSEAKNSVVEVRWPHFKSCNHMDLINKCNIRLIGHAGAERSWPGDE